MCIRDSPGAISGCGRHWQEQLKFGASQKDLVGLAFGDGSFIRLPYLQDVVRELARCVIAAGLPQGTVSKTAHAVMDLLLRNMIRLYVIENLYLKRPRKRQTTGVSRKRSGGRPKSNSCERNFAAASRKQLEANG